MGTYRANKNNVDNQDVPLKTEKEQKQESTEKAVDLAAETALDVYTGGQFSKVKGVAEKVPIVGKVVNKTWDKSVKGISKIASKTPIGDIAKKADESGLTDTARTVKSATNFSNGNVGNNQSGINQTGSNQNNSTNQSNSFSNSFSLNSKPFRLFGKSKEDNSNKSGNMLGSLFRNMPTGLKIKVILSLSGAFLLFLMVTAVFANDDNKNLSLTNGTNLSQKSTASEGDLLAKLEDLSNYFIENAGEYNQGAYLYVPQLNSNIRKDCTGFAVAYMSYVSGVDLPESYTGEMVEINGSWAQKASEAGWKAYSSSEIGDASNLLPGDVLIEHTSGTNGHAEIYISPTETFGWGSKQDHYPLSKTITNNTVNGKTVFSDGRHTQYRVIYRYMNSTSNSNIDSSNLNITKMNHSSFNHGTKSRSNQKYIMLHDTEMSVNAEAVINSWKNTGNGVAAHFVIDRDGTIIQAVDLDTITHHAGWGGPGNFDQKFGVGNNDGKGNGDDLVGTSKSGYESYTSYGMNSYSVGIEMCHVGGENYPEAQLNSLDSLILYIDSYFGFKSTIIDHKDWRPSNSDTDVKFSTYLNNYKVNRHH